MKRALRHGLTVASLGGVAAMMPAMMPAAATTTSQVPFVIAVVLLLVFSLGVHEAAHGQAALWCGDPTARDLGRITLNPIPHIDPFLTVILPAMLAFTGAPIFGGAKPVPVRMDRLKGGMRDMALVALAGPASNILLALFFGVLWAYSRTVYSSEQLMPDILLTAVYFNVLLAVFNMIPIPPLDGSRVVTWLLPRDLRATYDGLERFGILIVFGLILFVPAFGDLLWSGIGPVIRIAQEFGIMVVEPFVGGIR